MDKKDIPKLRDEIAALDRALMELLERRFTLAERVGRLKAEKGHPVVVREVEQRVLGRSREAAGTCGVSPDVMESIFKAVIHGSVERQHRVGVEMRAGRCARVLVLGAAGAMGGWLSRFLQSIGHRTEGVDTAWAGLPPAEGRYATIADVPAPESFEAIFVSVPLEDTPAVLNDLAARKLGAPVFEITSIKSHIRDSLAVLRSGGCAAVSLHPMFGPDKNPYGPLTVVHAAGSDEKGEREITLDLLGHPYLDLISIPFERHDRIMGWLLGLAHLTGMLFANALTHSGLDPAELGRVASTTFERQVDTAQSVLGEDAELYFSIQRLNPFQSEVYAALGRAMKELTGAIEEGDLEAFEEILARAARALPV